MMMKNTFTIYAGLPFNHVIYPVLQEDVVFQIWNVHSVLNVLHSLVEKSKINQQVGSCKIFIINF